MKISKTKTEELDNSLVIVSAREHGKIYQIRDGEMTLMEYVEERPPEKGSNDGFFFLSSGGMQMRAGAPRDEDNSHDIRQYINAITGELTQAIRSFKPEKLFVFEPEHMKGLIEEHVTKPNNLKIRNVRYGNFVQSDQQEIMDMLNDYKDDSIDASDPASVADGENADEIRKILEVGND